MIIYKCYILLQHWFDWIQHTDKMSTSTFITNRVKDNKNIYHSSGGINVSYDNKMNWLGRWDKIMNALTYTFGTYFFSIFMCRNTFTKIWLTWRMMQNTKKHTEKPLTNIPLINISWHKDYSWNTWNYKWQISKNSTCTSKREIGILNFDGL